MPARIVADTSKLTANLKKSADEAKKLAQYLARSKGGGGGGSRRPIVNTANRIVRGSYYDENARALGL